MHEAIDVAEQQEKDRSYNIRLLTAYFLYVTFSGAIRKWVVTDALTGNVLIGLQTGLPVAFALLAKTRSINSLLFSVLVGYSLLLTAMVFNPMAHTIYHGIVGFFLHVGVFLPILVYLNNREAFPVERMNRVIMLVAVVELVLGVTQFLSPATSPINRYVRDIGGSSDIAMLLNTGRVRIAGTFSYIGGMTSLFAFFGFFVWGLRLTKAPALLIYALILICGVITPMTGARGLAALMVILMGCAFVSTATDIGNSLALAVLFGLLLVVLQYVDVPIVREAYYGLNGRISAHVDDGENTQRTIGQIEEIINFRGNYPFFGTGLGATYQGMTDMLGKSVYIQEYGYYEEEPERIILEGGYLLFFARLCLWGLIVVRSRIPLFFGLLLMYLHVFYANTTFNLFTAFYTSLGIIYLDRCYHLRRGDG